MWAWFNGWSDKMGYKVTVLCFCLGFATVRAIEVNITNARKPYIGWEFNCSWAIPPDDSLRLVQLYKDDQKFMIYRPKADGGSSHHVSRREEDMMSTNCSVSTDDRQKGTCVITLELFQPPRQVFTISCEVFGERPDVRKGWESFFFNGFATVGAIEVNITDAWKPYIGWEFNCSWAIPPDDSLRLVQLYKNDQKFMIYRPKADGGSSHHVSRREEDMMSTNCSVSTDDRQKGTCVITLELFQPLRQLFTISCEVFGERPYVRKGWESFFFNGFVPPSDAVITVGPVNEESGPVTLNCSASYFRNPFHLSWTIGDHQPDRLPREFKGHSWNATSKLWDVWSAISYAPSRDSVAVCTPETRKEGKLVEGHAAKYNQYNAARNVKATDRPIEVNITNAWKPYIGWEINCSWAIPPDDSLQSVRLYKDYEQFMIYRPEADDGSSHNVSSREHKMSTNCAVPTDDRQKGTCVITLDLYRPLVLYFTISCEVSTVKPDFRMDSKNFHVDGFRVPPSDAVITVGPVNEESGPVTLNCSASYFGNPFYLSWTIGGYQPDRIPGEFSGASWNATTKLWHAWSVITYTPSSGSPAVCTPELSGGGKVVAKGHAAQYNAARNLKGGVFNTIVAVISLLLLII